VNDKVICTFTATPLEKYESYRLFLNQWSRCDKAPDFAPTIYNLVDSLASFLEINRHSPHNGTQPKFLVDMLPEVCGGTSDAMLRRLLSRKALDDPQFLSMLSRIEECGSAYLPEVNAFYVRQFNMAHAAEDAARFLHHACQGLPQRRNAHPACGSADTVEPPTPLDRFYARVIEHAVAYFGSRVLCPSRPTPSADIQLSRAACEKAAQAALRGDLCSVESSAQDWGFRIGSQMYDAYLAGRITPGGVRRLFLAHLNEPGLARKVCATVITKLRAIARPQSRAAHA
jgi:hypothetical protein